jgi:hypothetical protein
MKRDLNRKNIETKQLINDADLSYHSVIEAIKQLPEGHVDYIVLQCASQNMGEALSLTSRFRALSIRMNIDYDPDEWSVECAWYEDQAFVVRRIHTEGASKVST